MLYNCMLLLVPPTLLLELALRQVRLGAVADHLAQPDGRSLSERDVLRRDETIECSHGLSMFSWVRSRGMIP